MERARILCIDDEPDLLDTLRKVLVRQGHVVEAAASGEEGLVALEVGGHDLVITDLMMAGVDGMQILDRSRELRPDVPVLLVTAYATVETAIQAPGEKGWARTLDFPRGMQGTALLLLQ